MLGQQCSSGQSGDLASGYFQRDNSGSTEPNAADKVFHGGGGGGALVLQAQSQAGCAVASTRPWTEAVRRKHSTLSLGNTTTSAYPCLVILTLQLSAPHS